METKKPVSNVHLPYQPEDYAYTVTWSEEDQAYVGRVAEFASLAAHGACPTTTLQEITEVVRFVLEDLVESSEEVPAPFKGSSFSHPQS